MGFDKLQDITTVKQLSEFLQVSELTIKRALKSEELRGFKVGNVWRIEKEEVMKWLDLKK